MGRDLQKKKRRSGKQPVRQSQKPKRALNPMGNNIIAKNWYGLPGPRLFFIHKNKEDVD
jgi:nucleolar protein 16